MINLILSYGPKVFLMRIHMNFSQFELYEFVFVLYLTQDKNLKKTPKEYPTQPQPCI